MQPDERETLHQHRHQQASRSSSLVVIADLVGTCQTCPHPSRFYSSFTLHLSSSPPHAPLSFSLSLSLAPPDVLVSCVASCTHRLLNRIPPRLGSRNLDGLVSPLGALHSPPVTSRSPHPYRCWRCCSGLCITSLSRRRCQLLHPTEQPSCTARDLNARVPSIYFYLPYPSAVCFGAGDDQGVHLHRHSFIDTTRCLSLFNTHFSSSPLPHTTLSRACSYACLRITPTN